MALQGTLETFSVPEVLRLLAGTRKTGLLALEGDRGAGSVWLTDGEITGARSEHEPDGRVAAVLFDLLRYATGSFVFENGAEYDGESAGAVPVEEALVEAERLVEEWKEIEKVVPSLGVWVSMVPSIAADSVTVSAEHWAALAIIGRGTSGHRLGDDLHLGELDASRCIRDLAEAGLVDVDDTVVDHDAAPSDETEELTPAPRPHGDTDLTVGLAGFVARSSEEEREELRADVLDVTADLGTDEVPELELVAEDAAFFDGSVEEPQSDPDDPDPVHDFEPIADLEPVADAEVPADVEPLADVDPMVDGEPDEFLAQLANLSPKAAAAIEATASAGETASAGPRAAESDDGAGDEEINRNLLLKFLSSAKP